MLSMGEVELVLDAALNPYLNGTFVVSIGAEGAELEEGYATVVRRAAFRFRTEGW